MSTTMQRRGATARLRDQVTGRVVQPGDAGWDSARQAWNLAVDQQPAAVVVAEDVQDIVRTVRHAAEHRLGVATQGTGHGASAGRDLAGTVLLRTMRLGRVAVDPVRAIARVQAGAVWSDVVGAAAEHGLAPLAGTAGTVGVVGYTLGGGVGWLGRRHGLACNSVTAIELVDADGIRRRVDADHQPDLFWALRGGGGSFGVVCALEFALYPVRAVHAGMRAWPVDAASAVLERFLQCTTEAADGLSCTFRFLRLPPVAEIPEPLRGRHLVVVDAVDLGGGDTSPAALAPLRELPGAVIDTFARQPTSALTVVHGEPPHPHPGVGDGFALRSMPPAAAAELLALGAGDASAPLTALELRHLGGALAEGSAEHGALDAIDATYMIFGVGTPAPGSSREAIDRSLDRVAEAMAPWASSRRYLNFADREPSAAACFSPSTLDRLRALRRQWDPDERFRPNRPLEASEGGAR